MSQNLFIGMKIVTMLKEKLKADPILLAGVPVSSIDTLVCQNTCSGHGTCNQATRQRLKRDF